jgi:hypothetical protein
MIQRKFFYESVRPTLFNGALAQAQVDGLNLLLAEADQRGLDYRQTAYLLATAYHETARSLQPIAEYGKGQGKPYGVPDPQTGQTYYGRGYVQLTWKENYQKMQELLSVPLVAEPDLAMEPEIACQVIYEGMARGLFTGVGLSTYFTAELTDWINARKIVNALDRAEEIAGYAQAFHAALSWTPGEREEGSYASV